MIPARQARPNATARRFSLSTDELYDGVQRFKDFRCFDASVGDGKFVCSATFSSDILYQGLDGYFCHLADAPGEGVAFAACRSASSTCRRRIHAAGLGDGDVFGLNKRGNLNCGNLNLWGDGATTGVGVGVGDASAVAILRVRFGFGEASADSASEGDGVLSAGEMV